jgi:hypothetical protein
MTLQFQVNVLLAALTTLLIVVLGLQAYQMDRMRASLEEATEDVRSARKSVQALDERLGEFERRLSQEATEVARVVVSETNRPEEMTYIAWVVRHRYKAGWRGASSYRDVARDPWQFTGLSPASSRQDLHLGPPERLAAHYGPLWDEAVATSLRVLLAPRGSGPFDGRRVFHFYSPGSMGGHYPSWITEKRPVRTSIDPNRFTFLI